MAQAEREMRSSAALGKTAGEIWLAYTLSESALGFVEAIEERGLRLVCVSAQNVARNEADREGYQRYVQDHAEEAKKFGIKEPPRLNEGALVVVGLYKNEARVSALSERTTGDTRDEIEKFLGPLHQENF